MEEKERIVKGIWIPIEIWKDVNLSWNEKLLLLEIDSFTSSDKDCYISDEYIADFLGVNKTNANKTLSSLIKKGYVVKTKFDGRRRYVKAALSQSTTLPYQERQPSHAHVNSIIYNNIEDYDKTITKEEKEDTNVSYKKKSSRFVKPTVEQVDAYVREQGYHIDAENFINYYESKGWVVGKSPMKDWRAAVRTWERTWKGSHQKDTAQDLFSNAERNNDMVINGQIYK